MKQKVKKSNTKNTKKTKWRTILTSITGALTLISLGTFGYYYNLFNSTIPTIQTHQDTKNTTDTPTTQKKQIRIGFWNILNYDGDKETAREYVFANVINQTNLDIIALAEIKKSEKANGKKIIEQLNTLNPSNVWKELTTEVLGKPNQQERYTFLYKSNRFLIKQHQSEDNPYMVATNKLPLKYARPVVAVTFKDSSTKKDLTIATAHFDSPGVSVKRGEAQHNIYKSQGNQEIQEARNLDKVLADFDKRDGDNTNIIFMGDTNITEKAHDFAFENVLKDYRNIIDKTKNTSLSETPGKYVNSYDKIFYKGDLIAHEGQVYDLWNVFNHVDKDIYKSKLLTDKKQLRNKDFKGEARRISDHTMVYFDLEDKS